MITPIAIGPVTHRPKATSSQRIASQIKTIIGIKVSQQRTKYTVRLMEAS